MKKFFLLLCLFVAVCGSAQTGNRIDSLRRADSLRRVDSFKKAAREAAARRVNDSLQRVAFVKDSLWAAELDKFSKKVDTAIYRNHPFFAFRHPTVLISTKKQWHSKDALFYCIVGVLLFFAVTKNAFPRYLSDLNKIFFRTTLQQRQIRDQLINAPMPSLLFNILYVLSGGLFINLLLQHFHFGAEYPFLLLFGYSVAGLGILYTLKFVVLKLFGWILRIPEVADIYIFVIFSANKVLGVILLPFIISLAFMNDVFYQMAFSLSMVLIGLFFLYRLYLSYISIHKQFKINLLHFVLYLLAFEIAPLFLINKLLYSFFSES